MPNLVDQRQKELFQNLFVNRKKLGLTTFDIALFGYLAFISRNRVIISATTAELADLLNEPYNKVAASLKKFIHLDLIRKIKYKKHSGFIISPLILNIGSFKTKTFKARLWEGDLNICQPKKIKLEKIYPIQRKSKNDENLHSL
jgi:hypothetical protein